ncbi:hypothetical protein SASPL_144236 [Salvia splendens]|uniref:Uncharacterized protein n=1 Tax=Salvia splendens TaxID=180675 RepID=A0A8X8WNL4_SALSN|nr:hypothetical protein SASPL_144236 [Salvia splendens]
MGGIALFICGIKIDLSFLLPNYTSPSSHSVLPRFYLLLIFSISFCDSVLKIQPLVSEDDIKAVLQRRGPDSLGTKIVKLYSDGSEFSGELLFIGATLQLRGVNPVVQPLTDDFGNVLVYNGNSTYTSFVASAICLLNAAAHVYHMKMWDLRPDSSKTVWFGRDAFGRRSLLVHWLLTVLSSVSPPSSTKQPYDIEEEKGKGKSELDFWGEVSCGVSIKKHGWTDVGLKELITWERTGLGGCFSECPLIQHDVLSDFSSESDSFLYATANKVLNTICKATDQFEQNLPGLYILKYLLDCLSGES